MRWVGFAQTSVRQMNYYLAQGRGIRRIVTLFNSIKDLIAKNDRRYDDNEDTVKDCGTWVHTISRRGEYDWLRRALASARTLCPSPEYGALNFG
jgi:hypothetical protein